MSFDNQANVNVPAYPQQPKGSGKKWIFAGCGCLLVIGLICGGCIGMGAYFGSGVISFTLDNTAAVQSSRKVQEIVGTPVAVSPPRSTQHNRAITLEFDVSGPNGTGKVTVVGTMNDDFSVTRDEIYLEFDGQRIDLDPDAELDLNIEGE